MAYLGDEDGLLGLHDDTSFFLHPHPTDQPTKKYGIRKDQFPKYPWLS
jgi:hypothetical protein